MLVILLAKTVNMWKRTGHLLFASHFVDPPASDRHAVIPLRVLDDNAAFTKSRLQPERSGGPRRDLKQPGWMSAKVRAKMDGRMHWRSHLTHISGGLRIFKEDTNLLFCKFFAENCMEMKEFGPRWRRQECAPPWIHYYACWWGNISWLI